MGPKKAKRFVQFDEKDRADILKFKLSLPLNVRRSEIETKIKQYAKRQNMTVQGVKDEMHILEFQRKRRFAEIDPETKDVQKPELKVDASFKDEDVESVHISSSPQNQDASTKRQRLRLGPSPQTEASSSPSPQNQDPVLSLLLLSSQTQEREKVEAKKMEDLQSKYHALLDASIKAKQIAFGSLERVKTLQTQLNECQAEIYTATQQSLLA
jgi:hypothetical protein